MKRKSAALAAAVLTVAGPGASVPTAGAQEAGALVVNNCNGTMTSDNNMGSFYTRIPAYVSKTGSTTHRYSRCNMAKRG
ncbi:hypothetical protein [Streptomyces sp. S.PB5]|uniref:hypothetical protein n=1 Tax=Streptomyces sp. S.PB5 TaxID=3020844 RepID=UPI0025B0336F|nr:hypothetical protein [Streptomyces sp. S.PB5]MDN3028575.1 hypothetical protein [Streptomyces sp. S.PB5]